MQLAQILGEINWLAVVVATLASFMLGGLWYSKRLFGKAWMQEVGLTDELVNKSNGARTFGGTFALQFVAAVAFAALLEGGDWLAGLATGLWVGVFWVASAYGVTYLFEQRALRLWLINAGYYMVLYALMGAIIGAFN